MSLRSKFAVVLLFAVLSGLLLWPDLHAQGRKDKPDAKAEPAAEVKPEDRADSIKRGLAFLAEHQRPDGGWQTLAAFGAGVVMPLPVRPGLKPPAKAPEEPSDLGCTCLALMAFVRAGNTTTKGDYSKNVAKATEFIIHAVAKADRSTLATNERNHTQLQLKVGPHVDTFLSLLVLSELKGKLKDEKAEERLTGAVHKLIAKVEANQKKDGTYPRNNGWAPVLSQGVASKGLNRAHQAGYGVKLQTLSRDYDVLTHSLDRKTGRFGVGEAKDPKAFLRPPVTTKGSEEPDAPGLMIGDAGVALYSTSARAAGLQELVNSLRLKEDRAKEVLAKADAAPETKQLAKKHIELLEKADDAAAAALRGVSGRLEDKRFVAGFGTNGGEEFLSFMNISEALHSRGGDEWEKWDKLASALVVQAQDKDGSWSGAHCITGRTPTTAFALLTLMAERAPSPGMKDPEKK
jgi:hypothetical protein